MDLLNPARRPPTKARILAGAGESGKSTIIKQMRIIHHNGFSADERRQIKAVIYSNIIVAFRVLLEIMETENIPFLDEKLKAQAELIEQTESDLDADYTFTNMDVKKAMLNLWDDSGVKKAIAKGHEYALNDNLNLYVQSGH